MSEHVAQVCYTDNCCGDRKFLQETLGPASVVVEDAAHSTCFADEPEALQLLDFPDGLKANLVVVTRENCEVSARACLELLRRARASGLAVLGFDIEWSARPSGPRRSPATLQLSAPDGYTVVFQLKPDERKNGIMSAAIKELITNNTVKLVRLFWCATYRRGLCSSSIMQSSALANVPVYPRLIACVPMLGAAVSQAGVSVKADLTHVFNSYGVRGTQEVDVGQLAGQHLDVMVGARSLQALTATLLRRELHKGQVRTSNWETSLSAQQVS